MPPEGPSHYHVVSAVLSLPYQDRTVTSAREQNLPIRAQRERVHSGSVLLQGGDEAVFRLPGAPGPDPDLGVGGARVDDPVGGDGDGVDGVVVGGEGLEAPEVGPPDLEGLVPGNGVEEAVVVVGVEAGDGVVVAEPELLLVAADLDVAAGEGEAAEAVGEGGEDGDETVGGFGGGEGPDADPGVLVGGEDAGGAGGEGDGLDGAGGGVVGVEGVEVGEGEGVVDVDEVAGGGVEEGAGEGEGGDGGGESDEVGGRRVEHKVGGG